MFDLHEFPRWPVINVAAVCHQTAPTKIVALHHPADLDSGKMTVLAGGNDFVASPRLSPDGRQLAWVAWDHPNMPWDDTTLYLADVASNGSLDKQRKVSCC